MADKENQNLNPEETQNTSEQDYVDYEKEDEFDEGGGNNLDQKKKVILIIVVLATLFLLYKIFFSKASDKIEEQTLKIKSEQSIGEQSLNTPDSRVSQIDDSQIIDVQKDDNFNNDFDFPEIPDFNKIELPEPPVPEPEQPVAQPPEKETIIAFPEPDYAIPEALPPLEQPSIASAKNRAVSIVAYSGGGGSSSQKKEQEEAPDDPSLIDQVTGKFNKNSKLTENTAIAKSSFPRTGATYYGNRRYMLTQGKIIDAVLETAINTDDISENRQGILRALVARDVYSDAGNNILIPRGSKLIGVYSYNQSPGNIKVGIVWTRVLRPDGYDVAINSPGVDQIGRNGVQGIMDTRFIEVIKNAILVSGITIGGGVAGQKVAGENARVSTITDKDGKTEQSGKIVDLAVRDAIDNLTQIFKDYVERNTKENSVVYVHQGTPLKVFVNADLIFSRSISNFTRNINKVN